MTAKRIKIAPTPALKVPASQDRPIDAMCSAEPKIVLGNKRVPDIIAPPVVPSAASLFGPRAAWLVGRSGPLVVSDTGHHRLLIWNAMPDCDERPADLLIGQTDFSREGRNAKGEVGPSTLNVPTGICATAGGLAVADAWNHRVLLWKRFPTRNNEPADLVLGQSDFTSSLANRGNDSSSADSMHWPYGVFFDADSGKFIVMDTGNRRVLLWNELPTKNGQPADLVLGQTDFTRRDENAGSDPTAMSMRWPHAASMWMGRLSITDAGNNRILVWNTWPEKMGAPADEIIGQSNAQSVDHNRALYWPRENSLNMPYGISSAGDVLYVADTANSRILGWCNEACGLLGQPDFNAKGDNRWQPPVADSLCWPYGVQAIDGYLVISDSGNNRVSIWELSP